MMCGSSEYRGKFHYSYLIYSVSECGGEGNITKFQVHRLLRLIPLRSSGGFQSSVGGYLLR